MKILNLYAGLGGNRKLWGDSHEITAVEMEPKIAEVYAQQFPKDNLIIGDAHEYLLKNYENFDFIWSSPPCQTHSKMMKATRHKKKRFTKMELYQEIIFLQNFFKGGFVVENVTPYYKPLIDPTFKIGRHLFWANFQIQSFKEPKFKNFINAGNTEETEKLKKWLGINYEGNIYYKNNHCPGQVLRNCVHPKTGENILNSYLKKNKLDNANQTELF